MNTTINSENTTPEASETTTKPRRPGFWLRAIEMRGHQLTREYRRSLGATAREGISDEDYATTMATLEKMAVNLGWNDADVEAHGDRRHGFGPGRGFGPGFGPGFGGHRHPGMKRGHRRAPQAEGYRETDAPA